jgi:SMODS and SLOG-associating 2TM effector domain
MLDEQRPLIRGSRIDPDIFDDDSNLSKFRRAVGINVEAHTDDLEAARKGAKGLYKDVISIQRRRSLQYRFVEVVFYFALAAQIIIGATLTALGPHSKLHPIAITILGVVNTSTASVLALLKGKGWPDKLRKKESRMRKVQDYIEETETRLYFSGDEVTDEELDELLQTVFAKYNDAKDTTGTGKADSTAH